MRIVKYDDLVAVVSDAPQDDYDVTRENLLAHQRVTTQAMTRSEDNFVDLRLEWEEEPDGAAV